MKLRMMEFPVVELDASSVVAVAQPVASASGTVGAAVASDARVPRSPHRSSVASTPPRRLGSATTASALVIAPLATGIAASSAAVGLSWLHTWDHDSLDFYFAGDAASNSEDGGTNLSSRKVARPWNTSTDPTWVTMASRRHSEDLSTRMVEK